MKGRPTKDPAEIAFNAAFQRRLVETRKALGWNQLQMATALGVEMNTYKKYENRPGSIIPLYLLPKLVIISDTPYAYWFGAKTPPPTRLRVVR